ncbi:hypothetical protein JW835_16540 [bacterium]|nr:hypothetical protein [bacterium]
MKRSKTIYLNPLNKWIAILFLTQIYLFTTQGFANLSRGIVWFAISQFSLAGLITLFLLIHYLFEYHCGKKYIHFDETGVELKFKYLEGKLYLHWESIGRIRFQRRKIFIQLKEDSQKKILLKSPYEKYDEIKEDFIQFIENTNIVIEQR